MKVLFINTGMHLKNLYAFTNYNIEITHVYDNSIDNIDLTKYDVVYSPSHPINVNNYPNTKFIFGPHFSVFPNQYQMQIIQGKNVVYIQPSEWVKKLWYLFKCCENINIKSLPFGVNTNLFNEILPIEKRDYIFVYYKSRIPIEFQQVMSFLSQFNFKIKIFNYLTKYSEEDYLNCLHNSKFGIWVGRHESQGFALEEALSCNVPLLVWDVKSMNQEYGYNYQDFSATCIPYWDNRCGESFTNIEEMSEKLNKLIQNINSYKPREYILENLSIEKCSEKFINLVNNI